MVADAADTSLPAKSADAVVCIDALQLVPDRDGLLREAARVLRPGGRVVITTWERRGGEPADLPPEHSVAPLVEAAGLRMLVREDCPDWLDQQRTFYEHVIAEANPDRTARDRWNLARQTKRLSTRHERTFLGHVGARSLTDRRVAGAAAAVS